MADPETYREKEEIDEYRHRDPIAAYHEQLIESGIANKDELDQIDREVEEQLEAAIFFADASPAPDPSTIYDFIYADPVSGDSSPNGARQEQEAEGERG
jgi:pyruvate dehydrogenase E1 component alpha subunit